MALRFKRPFLDPLLNLMWFFLFLMYFDQSLNFRGEEEAAFLGVDLRLPLFFGGDGEAVRESPCRWMWISGREPPQLSAALVSIAIDIQSFLDSLTTRHRRRAVKTYALSAASALPLNALTR